MLKQYGVTFMCVYLQLSVLQRKELKSAKMLKLAVVLSMFTFKLWPEVTQINLMRPVSDLFITV